MKLPDFTDEQTELILEKYILPEFANNLGFLRARVCWVFGEYSGEIDFKNETINQIVEGVYKCLLDNELPVKMKAAVALNSLLSYSETKALLKPGLGQILQIYIKLLDHIDNEKLVSALEGLIETFKEEIVPYAFELVTHLLQAFYRFQTKGNKNNNPLQNQESDDEDSTDEELTACGCLQAIANILTAPLPKQLYLQIMDQMTQTFNYCFSPQGSEYLANSITCLNLILFNCADVTLSMWFYYPILCYLICGLPQGQNVFQVLSSMPEGMRQCFENVRNPFDYEYIGYITGCIKNFIGKGRGKFLTFDDAFGQNFVTMMFNCIDKIYKDSESDHDKSYATGLYISLIENHLGLIDNFIETIIFRCLQYITHNSKELKVINIEVIASAIWYNPRLTLSLLNESQLQFFFSTWFDLIPFFKSEFDKQIMLYGLSSIYTINYAQIPSVFIVFFFNDEISYYNNNQLAYLNK